jgi:microcystin-dependent protein
MDEILSTIKLFGGNFIPRGYMECNGQLLSVHSYQAVYALLGNTYGGSIQEMTFGLPKLTPPDEHMKYIICVEGVFPDRW